MQATSETPVAVVEPPKDRFDRQADIVPAQKLSDVAVTIVGVGAIGRQVGLQLASIGAPRIRLFDFDKVDDTNITTQGYREDQVGLAKVEALKDDIYGIDTKVRVLTTDDRFRMKYARTIGDAVFCCVDSMDARKLVWESVKERIGFFADGRMLGEVMEVYATDSPKTSKYGNTIFPDADANQGRCTAKSTIYTASIAAGLMVHQFTRWLRNFHVSHQVTLSLLSSEMRENSLNHSAAID